MGMKTLKIYIENSVIGGYFDSVNLREGYSVLEIRTPREVVGNE
jgi:hypothetical protein